MSLLAELTTVQEQLDRLRLGLRRLLDEDDEYAEGGPRPHPTKTGGLPGNPENP